MNFKSYSEITPLRNLDIHILMSQGARLVFFWIFLILNANWDVVYSTIRDNYSMVIDSFKMFNRKMPGEGPSLFYHINPP